MNSTSHRGVEGADGAGQLAPSAMPVELQIRLPWPPSANHMFPTVTRGKYAVRVLSKDGTEYRRQVGLQVLAQRVPRGALQGKLGVLIECYPGDRRARDLGNLEKAIMDSLKVHQVIVDDKNIDDLHLVRRAVSKPAYVVVTLRQLADDELDMFHGKAPTPELNFAIIPEYLR